MSHHNMSMLTNSSLSEYCDELPDFPTILSTLQQYAGMQNYQTINYSIRDFLHQYALDTNAFLRYSPVQLLGESLPMLALTESVSLQLEGILNTKIKFYVDVLCDVLNNKLAQRNYEENLPDEENVSEQIHSLQAGKIALLLRFKADDILALLFHDIARPTHVNAEHGHRFHSEEGDTILKPLFLTTAYCRYHTLAKYLLYQFCPSYRRGLISPVSQHSLNLQKQTCCEQIGSFNNLTAFKLAEYLYKLMFMRLIDDMSKVPNGLMVPKSFNHTIEYFTDDTIKQLLLRQITSHLNLDHNQTTTQLRIFEEHVDKALSLLLRAKAYSNNPNLYT